MENLKTELAQILEVEKLDLTQQLESFDCWDSMTILSIIALASENYNASISNREIVEAKTVDGLITLIESKRE